MSYLSRSRDEKDRKGGEETVTVFHGDTKNEWLASLWEDLGDRWNHL